MFNNEVPFSVAYPLFQKRIFYDIQVFMLYQRAIYVISIFWGRGMKQPFIFWPVYYRCDGKIVFVVILCCMVARHLLH